MVITQQQELQQSSNVVAGEHVDGGRSSTSSSDSECSVEVVDLEAAVCGGGGGEKKVHVARYERDCRICHLSMDAQDYNELGCSCKGDLGTAHHHCAQAWFTIKGNKTCEICGSTARNVTGASESESPEQYSEPNEVIIATTLPPQQSSETRSFWQGHRFLNFLLACMVFAFVISWLFHFNVPS